MSQDEVRKEARSTLLLAAGAFVGATLAAIGILQSPRPDKLPADAVAAVNGTYIQRADFERAFAALTEAMNKNGESLDNIDTLRQKTLDRLIDEELLVQRGTELLLPERDPMLRTQLSSRVLEMVANSQEEPTTTDEKTLRAFYEKDPARFRSSGRYRVDTIFFAVPADANADQDAAVKRRADDVVARLAKGERFEDLRASGDSLLVVLPDAPLPVAKLQDYLGSTATRAVVELEEGHTSAPIRGSDGYRILRLVERIEGDIPTFEAVRQDVENAYRKQEEDGRLRRFLERRRAAAKITIAL